MGGHGMLGWRQSSGNQGEGLGAHSATLRRHQAIGIDEEQGLVRRAQSGEAEALQRLFVGHFPLTVRTVQPYAGLGVALEDLLSEACFGFMDALERYEPTRGCRFMTYATWWIRHSVLRALSKQSRNVRLPRRRAARALALSLPPHIEVSLEAEGAGSGTLGAMLADPRMGIDMHVLDAERAGLLRDALASLPTRQRFVLEHRFGLGDECEWSLQRIAGELGISKERVRQVEKQALSRLRIALHSLATA